MDTAHVRRCRIVAAALVDGLPSQPIELDFMLDPEDGVWSIDGMRLDGTGRPLRVCGTSASGVAIVSWLTTQPEPAISPAPAPRPAD